MSEVKKIVTGHSFICEGKADVSAREIADMLGLSRIFRGKLEEYHAPPPESENLSAEIYTESCETCGGRSRADKNHVEDLIQRCALSNSPHPVYFLHKHWPHFAEFNRLMQFHCSLCRLHFRGARSLAVHLYLHHQHLELNMPKKLAVNRIKSSKSSNITKQNIDNKYLSPPSSSLKSSIKNKEEKLPISQNNLTAPVKEEEEETNGIERVKLEKVVGIESNPLEELDDPTDGDEEDDHVVSDDDGHHKDDFTEAELSAEDDNYIKTENCPIQQIIDCEESIPKDICCFERVDNKETTTSSQPLESELTLLAQEKCNKHGELYNLFLTALQELCDKPPGESMISLLQPFLCANSPHFYKIAYLTGSYETSGFEDNSGYYDTFCVNYMQLQKQLLSAMNQSTDSCEWPCLPDSNSHANQNDDDELMSNKKSFHGLYALKTQISQVLMNRLDELDVAKSVEGLELSRDEFEQNHYDNPFRPEKSRRWAILKCASCDEPIHSLRMHLTEVLWLNWPNNAQATNPVTGSNTLSLSTPWSHISLIMRTANLRFLGTNLHCPVCLVHFGDSRSIYFLIYHMRIHGGLLESSNNKPNDFMMKHIRLMNEITDILVARVVGDISIKKAGNLLNQKFACKEGYYYWLRQTATTSTNVTTSKPKVQNVSSTSCGRGNRRGVKRTLGEDLFNSTAIKRACVPNIIRMDSNRFSLGGAGASTVAAATASTVCPANRQSSINQRNFSSWNFEPSTGRSNVNRQIMPRFNSRQPPRRQTPPVSLLNIPYKSDRTITCELCNTNVDGEPGLSVHLLQTLFRLRSRPDGLRIAERHLMCFPGMMVYRQRVICPACKIAMPSLDACMAHINLGQGQDHRAVEQKIITYYISCMAHRINLDTVIAFLKSEFCIRD